VRIADPASLDDRHEFEDLERVLHRLWVATLGDELQLLSRTLPLDLERIGALNERIRQHKLQMTARAA
jgi:hypothetical protein